MNEVCFKINNCYDCPYSYIEKIYTPDPFDHEEGIYCSKVEDENSCNKKHKLIVSDDWDIRRWSQIPDWCPLLRKEKI